MMTLTAGAQAALTARSGGMIYDSTQNLTWLADLNYAHTSGYPSSTLTARKSVIRLD